MSADPNLFPHVERLAYATGGAPSVCAQLKCVPEDFIVEETLGFTPSGEGEHLYIHLRAVDYNTEFLVSHIARGLGVPKKVVVYSGLKDRYAVTSQWFSVHLPGNAHVDLSPLENEHITILEAARNLKKLRRGAHKGNRFTIRLKHFESNAEGGKEALQETVNKRIAMIQEQGFPNYFGPQRFGNNENNIASALRSVESGRSPKKRFQRSMTYSTLRSLLFNLALSQRIKDGTWKEALVGDVFALSGTESFFTPDVTATPNIAGGEEGQQAGEPDDDIAGRLASGDIAVAGPLYGDGKLPQTGIAAETLLATLEPYSKIMDFLVSQRVAVSVRPYSVVPKELTYEWEDQNTLVLSFFLPKGVFATSLLRELVVC